MLTEYFQVLFTKKGKRKILILIHVSKVILLSYSSLLYLVFAWKSFIYHVYTIDLPGIWGLLTKIKGVIYQYTKFDDDFKISEIS